jgi:hypothetical protein
MSRAVLLITGVLLLIAAAPAMAQDGPGVVLGDPTRVAGVPVRHDGVRVGDLVVERTGSAIVATASFRGRPPGRRITVCVTVSGDRSCVRRRARRNGTVELHARADFTAPLRARVRSGGARGALTL